LAALPPEHASRPHGSSQSQHSSAGWQLHCCNAMANAATSHLVLVLKPSPLQLPTLQLQPLHGLPVGSPCRRWKVTHLVRGGLQGPDCSSPSPFSCCRGALPLVALPALQQSQLQGRSCGGPGTGDRPVLCSPVVSALHVGWSHGLHTAAHQTHSLTQTRSLPVISMPVQHPHTHQLRLVLPPRPHYQHQPHTEALCRAAHVVAGPNWHTDSGILHALLSSWLALAVWYSAAHTAHNATHRWAT
jgi:hypothetical protein